MAQTEICFISYISRSGSTLLSRLLSERYSICVTPEGSFPAEMIGVNGFAPINLSSADQVTTYLENLSNVSKIDTWQVKPDTQTISGSAVFSDMLRLYRDTHFAGDATICYKGDPVMPWEVSNALSHHQNAAAIIVMRDPRAILQSQENAEYAYEGGRFSHAIAQNAREWTQLAQAAKTLETNPRVLLVKYEDLVLETDKTLARIATFLGADKRNSANTKSFADTIATAEQHLHTRVTSPPDPARLDAWRTQLDPRKQATLEQMIADDMIHFGYTPSAPVTVNKAVLIASIAKDRFARISQSAQRHGSTLLRNPKYFWQKLSARLRPKNEGQSDG